MRTIYKYYKERLIEISGKNRSLYSKKISKKFSYDLGMIIGDDKEQFQELIEFMWKGRRRGFTVIDKNMKEKIFVNFGVNKKLKAQFADQTGMSAEEKRLDNLKRERQKREETKKVLLNQVSALKSLKREIEEFAKETGRYEMFVGYPFVTGYIGSDLQIKAPLILFPVTINVEDDSTVSFEAKQDEYVQLNKVLLLAYAKAHKLNIDGLIMEFDNLMDYRLKNVDDVIKYLDSFGISIKHQQSDRGLTCFDNIKEPNRGDSLKIVNACVIGRFPLANSIYNDYTLLDKRRLSSDAIDELLESRPSKKVKKPNTELYTINDLDYAQENAITKLNKFGNMVIYGPPGTGKSQTIVNIISDALCKDKKVLVVSQKKAALDVVFNRLKELNSKCMFIVDAEKNKVAFYERCKQMHQEIIDCCKSQENYQENFEQIQTDIENETQELQKISDTLFTKTPFGLTLQQLYTNSARIGKNSTDYEIYKKLVKNKDLMKLNFEDFYQATRVITEKNKCDLYYKYIHLKKANPLVDHIKSNLEIHTVNQIKTFVNNLLNKNLVPFDSTKYPHSRQLMAYLLENNLKDNTDIKPLVQMISKVCYPQLHKKLTISKFVFPLYPYYKKQVEKTKYELEQNFNQAIVEIKNYVGNYKLLEKVLDRKGYVMTVDNILNGNHSFLRLLLNALNDYIVIRDVVVALKNVTYNEKIILDFAFACSKSLKNFKEIVDKLLDIRIYHEAITYEEKYKNTLSKIIDFENIRNRILSLKNESKSVASLICLDKFREDYQNYYYSNPDNKNYLYQITKQQSLLPIRRMMDEYGEFLLKLFPCWLLSPESVSNIFPLEKNLFDIVLFDEASQVFIENTLPTIYRGKFIVVAGDNKQLRPTSTFMKRYMGNDAEDELDMSTQAALEVESLLDLATSRYSSTNLTYHYRSRNEELINFSNYAFYDGKLQIAPNITKNIGKKPIERIKVNGSWIGRKNQEEANAVVALLKKLIKNKRNKFSIGIITFNSEQEATIEDAIDKECQKDSAFRDAYIKEQNRIKNGEDESIFTKNLENVQGDERDIIIFSTGYARNEYGRVVAHFGPLSIEGGENRLNVAITRAKEKIYVVTSIEPEELQVEGTKNAGPKIFKKYLQYVRAVSMGKKKEISYILDSFKPVIENKSDVKLNQLEVEIKDELEKLGYDVETNLGNTNYKLSLAVYDKKLDRYLLGIECDYAAYQSSDSVLERDVYRVKFLQSRGWKIMRVWSRDWWLNKNKVISNITKQIELMRKKLKES